jgi:hypothetical protein
MSLSQKMRLQPRKENNHARKMLFHNGTPSPHLISNMIIRKRKKLKGLEGLEEPKTIESPKDTEPTEIPIQSPPTEEEKSKKIQNIWEQMKQENLSTVFFHFLRFLISRTNPPP